MALSERESYLVAHATLAALPSLPLLVIWLISFFTARQARDPARYGFIFMKIAYPLFIASCAFYTANDALLVSPAPARSSLINLSRMFILARFFERLAHAILIICLAELGAGFLTRLTPFPGSTAEQSGMWFRVAVRVIAGVLAASLMAVAAAFVESFERNVGSTNAQRNSMFAGMQILSLVAAVGLMVLGMVVMHRLKGGNHRPVAALYLTACTTYLVSSTWRAANTGIWHLDRRTAIPLNITLADVILSTWAVFAILIILYCMGAMKHGGIWTVQQPWQFAVTPQPVMVPGYAVQTPYGLTQVAMYQQPVVGYPAQTDQLATSPQPLSPQQPPASPNQVYQLPSGTPQPKYQKD